MALIYPRLDRAAIAPPHRRSLAAVFVVSAAALYMAVNLFALDHGFVEWIRFERIRAEQFAGRPAILPAAASLRIAAALATAAFPVAFFLWGIRARRRLLHRHRHRFGGPLGVHLPPLRTDRPALGLAHRVRRRPHRGRALGAPSSPRRGRRGLARTDGLAALFGRRRRHLSAGRARRPHRRPRRARAGAPRLHRRRRRVRGRRRLRDLLATLYFGAFRSSIPPFEFASVRGHWPLPMRPLRSSLEGEPAIVRGSSDLILPKDVRASTV